MIKILIFCSILPFAFQIYTPEFLEKIPPVDLCLADAKRTEIFYYLFKSKSQTTAIVLNEDYILPENDRKTPMKILLHGFTSNVTSSWYKEMKNAYFQKGPHKIIYIDWSIASNKSYSISSANVKPVGEYVADFVKNLQVPLENVHLIGHSLGSHLAGFIGRSLYAKTGHKVARITGTDPAGPGFEQVGYEMRLSKYDADFVDVVHTDIEYFGISKAIGHVDFYVNGGLHQRGCPSRKQDENCSHARSNMYFTESINTKNVIAKEAKFDEVVGKIIPAGHGEVEFGDSMPTNVRGMYHFSTNSTPPFLIPKKIKRT